MGGFTMASFPSLIASEDDRDDRSNSEDAEEDDGAS